jgi:hypothetical protein
MTPRAKRLFPIVMGGTIVTTVFAWLPLVRIVGRPEGYHWRLFGIGGSGTEGPFGVFVILAAYAFTMVFTGMRGPHGLFRVMLVLWHGALAGGVVVASVRSGFAAAWEGQGLHFSIPMPVAAVPVVVLAALAVVWAVKRRPDDRPPTSTGRSSVNRGKLALAIVLLPLAIVLFRLGTNYNWVTALAILVTIPQWVLLLTAFDPQVPDRVREA